MKKRDLIRKNMVESVNNERNILALANNPFVVRFYYSFTSSLNLYIVMEYLNGGDCYRWEMGGAAWCKDKDNSGKLHSFFACQRP